MPKTRRETEDDLRELRGYFVNFLIAVIGGLFAVIAVLAAALIASS